MNGQNRIRPIVRMEKYLRMRDYSSNTITAYKNQVTYFFTRTGLRPDEVRTEDITLYMEKVKEITGCSRAYLVQLVSALKCYYNHGFDRKVLNPAITVPLPKKERKYPDILSKEEVRCIINQGTLNLKHEFLLMMIYSSGLRVSEAVSLRLNDLDFDRHMIHIRNSKGKKDRYIMFSDACIKVFDKYKNRYYLENWLFPGAKEHSHLSIRTAQLVFETACHRINLSKNVSIHSLRHAFATHLLEDGVDLKYIQELLGHKNIKTTEIYTHVTQTSLRNIRSPIDRW
ncbi:MAG: tyrosine-type recombinase/integrase [Spirochaetales bacterium]|nr:tyrosine-type recombinase/integrase [Spirochaetales bacterium]